LSRLFLKWPTKATKIIGNHMNDDGDAGSERIRIY